MSGLHPLSRWINQRIGRCDDMAGGTIIIDQVGGLWSVIRLETTDELHRSTVEGVDVLIVVSYRKEGELAIFIL